MSNIPIVIICYNNFKYLLNTLQQIKNINEEYYKNIIIMDNCSTCDDTKKFLQSVDVEVIYRPYNLSPDISTSQNIDIYNKLPDQFVLTDPDLQFNHELPKNFIEILFQLSQQYKHSKIGFALDISDFDKMYSDIYVNNINIYEWESRFWNIKIENTDYELYDAEIDTTFCLINKNFNSGCKHIRVAGNFLAKHLPWYINNTIYNLYENYLLYTKTSDISTIKKLILSHINKNYEQIYKNNEMFLISKNDKNINFWKNNFLNWENETFNILDNFLSPDKIFIDIGAWVGTTSLYGSRKSKYVYSIEADKLSFNDLSKNMNNNCNNNYTLINKAIYHIDNCSVNFGKNLYLNNSVLNDSTSHIYTNNQESDAFYEIETITIFKILETVDINNIGLIKVDIEGGEEYILSDLYNIHTKYNIPVYISFHYDWWKDKNLDRFSFLEDDNKYKILNNPFISILFA